MHKESPVHNTDETVTKVEVRSEACAYIRVDATDDGHSKTETYVGYFKLF